MRVLCFFLCFDLAFVVFSGPSDGTNNEQGERSRIRQTAKKHDAKEGAVQESYPPRVGGG